MNAHRTTGRALPAGLGLMLVAALAVMNGCATPDPRSEPESAGTDTAGGSASDTDDGPLGAAVQRSETTQCCGSTCLKKICVIGMEQRGCDANNQPYVYCIDPFSFF